VPWRGPEAGNTHGITMMKNEEHKICNPDPEKIAIFRNGNKLSTMKEQRRRPRRDAPAADQGRKHS